MVRRSSETNTPMELHGKTIALYGLLVFLVLISATEPAPSTITAKRFWLCLFKNTLRRFASLDGKVTPGICDDISVKGSNIGQVSYPSKHSSTTAASHLRSRKNSEGSNAGECYRFKVEARCLLKHITVMFQKEEDGSDWYVNISWTPLISENAFLWTGYYVMFSVGNEKATRQFCLPKNRTNAIVSSEDGWYYPNLIFLNVTAMPNESYNKSDKKVSIELHPYNPKKFEGTTLIPLHKYDEKRFNEPGPNESWTYVAIGIGSLVGLGLVAGLLLYVWPSKKTIPLPSDYEYHAFICHSKYDISWVKEILLPFLEEENHLKCCIHYKDFTPGIPFIENMESCIYKSYKTIAVYSSNFIQSFYSNYELGIATQRLVEKGDRSVVVIRIDDASSDALPKELNKRSFIDYASPQERTLWKKKLLKFFETKEEDVLENPSKNEELNNNRKYRRSSSHSSYSSENSCGKTVAFKELSIERLI